jgi:predicted component of type VI protein secretion system
MGVRFVVRSRGGEKIPGEPEFPFDQSRIVIGRGSAADVRIPHRSVSEHHASVQARDGHFVLTDLGSTNGTRLDGQRLTPGAPRRLRDGDRITIGIYELSFHAGVLVTEGMTAERTAELARRLVRDAQAAGGARVAPARLCVLSGPRTGATLELAPSPSRALIGSAESCQLVLSDPELAAEHCEVVCDNEGVVCRSLLARASVAFGEQVLSARRLRDGDEITLGTTRLLFEEPAQALLDVLKGDPDEAAPFVHAPRVEEPTAAIDPPPSAAAPVPRAEPARSDADLFIYALAGAVLVASLAGLMFLLRQ